MSVDFIDELERELRAASRRRVRLVLAPLPALPSGAVVLMVALVISAAVVVPLLAVHSRSSTGHRAVQAGGRHSPTGPGGGHSIVVGCQDAVYGQLAPDWRSPRAGTVVAGPIAWVSVLRFAPAALVSSHFVEAIAVVDPGRGVTLSVPVSERSRLSIDYTSVAPLTRFYLSQGASSVTLMPCARNQGLVGPDGRTQFIGGFIVAGPQCAEVDVQSVGSATRIRRFLPLGRSCTNRLANPSNASGGTSVARGGAALVQGSTLRLPRGRATTTFTITAPAEHAYDVTVTAPAASAIVLTMRIPAVTNNRVLSPAGGWTVNTLSDSSCHTKAGHTDCLLHFAAGGSPGGRWTGIVHKTSIPAARVHIKIVFARHAGSYPG